MTFAWEFRHHAKLGQAAEQLYYSQQKFVADQPCMSDETRRQCGIIITNFTCFIVAWFSDYAAVPTSLPPMGQRTTEAIMSTAPAFNGPKSGEIVLNASRLQETET